jgi:peptidoglycan/LPS O-acetylase OafA/YrhL
MALEYRKDIDGLRAVAVLPVVLYHAGLGFPGGFVGVDVFFVISGYLITTLLADELGGGRFSLWRFYERRARRILPALLAVICASAIAAWALFMPTDLTLFGRSASAATLFYANFLFRHEAGYFDAVAAVKPLLHTWSLAIEEQFYVLFPGILYLLFRRHPSHRRLFAGHRWPLIGTALLTLLSFAISVWWVESRPVDAFYLLPSRFWELGLGAILALWPQVRPAHRQMAVVAGASGLAMIILAVLAVDASMPFPGLAALLPCLGAVLVIFAGRTGNLLSALLGAAPARGIGRISYSLYLWHWPLIVFLQYWQGHVLTPWQAALVVAVSIGLAILSWAVIEQPVRQRHILDGWRPLWSASLSVMALFAATGFVIAHHHGFPSRLSPAAANIYAAKSDTSRYGSTQCFTDSNLAGPTDDDVRAGRLCPVGDIQGGDAPAAQVSFLVWGDSHSGTMTPGIGVSAARFGQRGLLAGEGGCPPLLDYQNTHPSKARRDACVARNAAVLDLVTRQHIPLVFMVARWPREVLGVGYGDEGPYFDPQALPKTEDRTALVGGALDRTLAAFAALHVHAILVMDVPEIGYDVPYTLARAAAGHRTVDVNPPRAVVLERQRLATAMLQDAARKYGAEILDPTAHFCSGNICHGEIDGRPLYIDSDHITRTTSESLSDLFDGSFQRLRDLAPASNAAQVAPTQAKAPATLMQSSFAMPGNSPSQ